MPIKPAVLELGFGIDLHGTDSTTAARRAVFDAIHRVSLPFLQEARERGGKMRVEATIGVPAPETVDLDAVRREFPHGEVTVQAVEGGLRVPFGDTILACAAVLVSVEFPDA